MIVKNYKEMCKLLGEDVKSGRSKKCQITNRKDGLEVMRKKELMEYILELEEVLKENNIDITS